MSDLQITIQEQDTSYDLLVTYYDKKYLKTVDAAYLDTCLVIIKTYPHILKDLLVKNKDKPEFFTFTESKKGLDDSELILQYDGILKMKFTIDLQFGKEVMEIILDQVGTVDLSKKNSDMIKQLQNRIDTLEGALDYVFRQIPKPKGVKHSFEELWLKAKEHIDEESNGEQESEPDLE